MEPTFLTAEQIWGNKALDIMKRCGATCAASDLAKILGAVVNPRQDTAWWSASAYDIGNVRVAVDSGS